MRPHIVCLTFAATLLASAAVSAATKAETQAVALVGQPFYDAVSKAVEEDALRATVTRLVAFGTRHTLSDTVSETRGIGAARRWVETEFRAIDAASGCDGCLDVFPLGKVVSGRRLPAPTEVVNVVAVQRGTTEPERVILITAHLDSRVTDVMDATSDAPGANDDASGVAVVLEAARVLSQHRFPATLVYAALSGEEQGLYGGQILADHAKAQGWQVQAQLNNDIVGNSHGMDGIHEPRTVRVFSEATSVDESPERIAWRAKHGGENDSPSRNLARWIAQLAERRLPSFRARLIYRTDRDGRGGDQIPFLAAGYPAVRFTEAHEDYRRQHQNLRTESGIEYGDTLAGVDFAYLADVARLNLVALAELARAPAPPRGVVVEGAVTPHTVVRWQPVPGAAGYRLRWRESSAAQWQHAVDLPADAVTHTLRNTVIDDWAFGVASFGSDGSESPTTAPSEVGGSPSPTPVKLGKS